MDYRYVPFYMQGNAITGIYYGQWGMSEDRDIDYVKEMYPMTFSKIQEVVEQECDRQEFTGSMMFDEYPDKLGILQIVNRIFGKVKEDEGRWGNEREEISGSLWSGPADRCGNGRLFHGKVCGSGCDYLERGGLLIRNLDQTSG